MLYFAYGSNLNKRQMASRCPGAVPLGRFTLDDARLVFRGVADVAYEPGAKCLGGVWRITPACEVALDRYEGVARGLYRREIVEIDNGESLLYYVMRSTGIFPPSWDYLESIREGYRDFKIPQRHLIDAVRASWDDKNPSHIERRRYRLKGRPALAKIATK